MIASSDVLLERNIIRRNNVEQLTGYYPAAVKIFNQTRRVTFRDNLITEQPYSNGVWYDVGNRDGVIVDNWIEGTEDGFFFEISYGATVAGNVFVNNHKGARMLNAAGVHLYQNTFVNSTASFERNERSAVGDHFGWHSSTGPDVDEREGHVFVNNLLVADADFDRPLLNFEQPAALCADLSRPMVTQPRRQRVCAAGGRGCRAPAHPVEPGAHGYLPRHRRRTLTTSASSQRISRPTEISWISVRAGVFKGPDLGRYDLLNPIPSGAPDLLPDAVRELLGWSEAKANVAGAWPASR